jgi:hypothetical protein
MMCFSAMPHRRTGIAEPAMRAEMRAAADWPEQMQTETVCIAFCVGSDEPSSRAARKSSL